MDNGFVMVTYKITALYTLPNLLTGGLIKWGGGRKNSHGGIVRVFVKSDKNNEGIQEFYESMNLSIYNNIIR